MKWNQVQDCHLQSKLGYHKYNYFSLTFNLDCISEEEKKNQSITKGQIQIKKSCCSEDDMMNKGSDDEIDDNEGEQEDSSKLKQIEIRKKLETIMMQEYR